MMLMYAAINVGFLSFLAYQGARKEEGKFRVLYVAALVFKLVAGLGLGLLYTNYYDGGDTITFFQDGRLLADYARVDGLSYIRFLWSGDVDGVWSTLNNLPSRTLFIVKVVSIVNLISHDNYWVSSLYFSFLSFTAAWALVKVLMRMSPMATYGAVVAFLFFPSVVFWTSGLMKESLAMAGLFLLTALVLKQWLHERLSWWEWVLLPLSLWLVWQLKYYYLAVFLPLAFAALMVNRVISDRGKSRSGWYSLLIWAATLMIPLALVSRSRPNFYPNRFMDVVAASYEEYRSLSEPDDLIDYDGLQPTVKSMVQHAPWALFSGLFRKLPWECNTVFQILSSFENVLLLAFTVGAMRNLPHIGHSPSRVLLWSALAYCTLMCIFLALSTPNFGTLSRYRVAFLPFYALLISIENPLGAWIQRRIQRSTHRLVP